MLWLIADLTDLALGQSVRLMFEQMDSPPDIITKTGLSALKLKETHASRLNGSKEDIIQLITHANKHHRQWLNLKSHSIKPYPVRHCSGYLLAVYFCVFMCFCMFISIHDCSVTGRWISPVWFDLFNYLLLSFLSCVHISLHLLIVYIICGILNLSLLLKNTPSIPAPFILCSLHPLLHPLYPLPFFEVPFKVCSADSSLHALSFKLKRCIAAFKKR